MQLVAESVIAAHSGTASNRRALLFVAGHRGRVGSALLTQLATERHRLRRESGIDVCIAGTVNRHELVLIDPDRHDDTHISGRSVNDWQQIIRHMQEIPAAKRLFIDCTADAGVAGSYRDLFAAGIGVVTPNKLANSSAHDNWHALRLSARQHAVAYRYETTVGAALPVLGPLHALVRRGERIRRIEAVLSGTLSFIFQRLNYGLPFSEAVREARDRGYTEPHPAEDLTGTDCLRKLLILLREAGFQWEPERVCVENLLTPELASIKDPNAFLTALAEQDLAWRHRVKAAHKRSLRLAYLARFDGRNATVGVTHTSAQEPFALLAPGENLIRIWSDHYDPVPLSIAGPGAGPALTAAGVLSDILEAARDASPT